MELSVLKYMLNIAGYPENTFFRPTELVSVLTDSDGSLFYNVMYQKINFATDENLIKIKYSKLSRISSLLRASYFTDSTHMVTKCDVNKNPYRESYLRFPKAGDSIRLLIKSDSSSEDLTEKIIAVNYDSYRNTVTFTLEDDVLYTLVNTDKSKYIPYLVLQTDKELLAPFKNTSNVYIESDLTDFVSDVTFSINDHLIGLEFDKNAYTNARGL